MGVGRADDGPRVLVLLAVLRLHPSDDGLVEAEDLDALAQQRLAHLRHGRAMVKGSRCATGA
eukprot:1771537-Prymnesium_polylepis.1